jgi:hypothetical protein
MAITSSELVAGVVIAALGAGIGAGVTYLNTNRQMDVKMVEIAVGILSQEPKENIAPAREWAVDVIDHYAQVSLSPQVRDALVNNRAVDLGYYGTSYYGSDIGSLFGGGIEPGTLTGGPASAK